MKRFSLRRALQYGCFSLSLPPTSIKREACKCVRLFSMTSAVVGVAGIVSGGYFLYPDVFHRQITVPYLMPLLRRLDPEFSHTIAVQSCKYGLVPQQHESPSSSLCIRVFNHDFPNPLGMAAGFDKNGETMTNILDMGYSFIEIGTIVPEPQEGNHKPRNFRLTKDKSVINRYGFNSDGVDVVADRLEKYRKQHPKGEEEVEENREEEKPNFNTKATNDKGKNKRKGIIGINIGKNKTTDNKNAAKDYCIGVQKLAKYADYIVLNVSSPNTAGLRDLQENPSLERIIDDVRLELMHQNLQESVPLLVKLSPDLTSEEMKKIGTLVLRMKLDGLIMTNTTVTRPETLQSSEKGESGGLSGEALKPIALVALKEMYQHTKGKIPIIGVGGISNANDVYERIKAGASLVQLYTASIYHGPYLAMEIEKELEELVKADGLQTIQEAIGKDNPIKEEEEAEAERGEEDGGGER